MHEYGKKNQNEIKHAFAILPKNGDEEEKHDPYMATRTKKMVYVKRIDVNDCVKKIKNGDGDGLRDIVAKLISPHSDGKI